ncbi:hypothetical protein Q5P01_011107 [Channa striata]|uniref:Dynein heavy chain ATP-binding dynein motor region domain-containing protein n=1 Tax=Channa striata TaxID=64152 RepID=A0AA88MVS9_CHASR|nr:hypothetical protein Q5P01_011107 [Channa striata]
METYIADVLPGSPPTINNFKEQSSVESWAVTKWRQINVDQMDAELRRFAKEQANISHQGPKWIVLDGDIDPMWIESLNTMMDDNKAVLVHTAETVRLRYFMDLLLQSRQPVMLVGNAGVGKTALVRNKLVPVQGLEDKMVTIKPLLCCLLCPFHKLACAQVHPHTRPVIFQPLFMAYVHTSVNQASEKYQRNEKRHNYTSPRSFLHQITPYKNLLDKSWTQLQHKMNWLDSHGLDPVLMIADDATVAAWHNRGLPNDRMSIENAAILTTSEHWPLIIDPQQQGIKWIRKRLGSKLRTVQLGQKGTELKRLEDDLLSHLSAAHSNFLGDISLVVEARENETKINEAPELCRPAAEGASLLFFIISDLNKINPMYQFSLKAFNLVFTKAMAHAERHEDVRTSVQPLTEAITYSVFLYTSQDLFERDKLTFLSHTAFQNVQLMARWLPSLEVLLESGMDSHPPTLQGFYHWGTTSGS